MTIQKHIEILNYDHAKNKCGKKVVVAYCKPTLDFIDYVARNNDQHLPIQYGNKLYHVVVDKLNTIPYPYVHKKGLETKLDKVTNAQIPQNSPEFLGKEQYYALFFDTVNAPETTSSRKNLFSSIP